MQRFLRQIRNLFRRDAPIHAIQGPSRNHVERRPSPPADARVASGRITRARSRSKSPKPWRRKLTDSNTQDGSRKGPKAPPWKDPCSKFTELLIRLVQRHRAIQLSRRQLADVERSWTIMQQRMDATTLRRNRLDSNSGEKARADRFILQQVVDQKRTDLKKLYRERLRLESEIDTRGAVQEVEEADMFRHWHWVNRHCTGKAGCILITPALNQNVQDAADVREFVHQERESTSRPNGNQRIQREADEANLHAPPTREQRLTMTAREQHLGAVLHNLYSHAGASLLQQGVLQPQNGHRNRTTFLPASTAVDDPPRPRPELTAELQEKYEEARAVLEECVQEHDEYDDKLKQYLDIFFKKKPEATGSDFNDAWRQGRDNLASNVRTAEARYVEARDEAFEAGAEPLPLRIDRERIDFAEFGGAHPDDGETDSEGTGARGIREGRIRAANRAVRKWLGQDDGHANEDTEVKCLLEPIVDGEAYRRLVDRCQRKDRSLYDELKVRQATVDISEHDQLVHIRNQADHERMQLSPWESASQQERRPYLRNAIDRRQGHEKCSGNNNSRLV